MWSVSGSALEPSSLTICPLTATWPEVMSSSALRRDATPAAAIIFCRRSEGIRKMIEHWGQSRAGGSSSHTYEALDLGEDRCRLLGQVRQNQVVVKSRRCGFCFRIFVFDFCRMRLQCGAFFVTFGKAGGVGNSAGRGATSFGSRGIQPQGFARQFLKLFHTRKFVDVTQSEAQQELPRGFIKNRTADDSLASGGSHELAIEQGSDNAAGVHAKNLADLRYGDGLLVADYRQGLERLQRETHRRLQTLGEGADHIVVLRLGSHTVPAGNLADLHSALRGSVLHHQFLDSGANCGLNLRIRGLSSLHQRHGST